jgi:MFS family permease
MRVRRDLLLRFFILYGMLYCSFGLSSPFLPAFLTTRGIGYEWLGFLLGAGTAVRLFSAPFAGRFADVFGTFRLELALFAIAAAVASLLYLPAQYFWLLALVNLTQAAVLAPLVPLADALALSWSRSTTRGGAFEYGWVRGIGSAAFIAGVLVAGQSAVVWGLPSVLWLTAAGLFATALSTRFVPDLSQGANSTTRKRKIIDQDWLVLLRQPVFARMVLAAALVLGSHAMHDAFAIIRWRNAGISPAVSSALWRWERRCWFSFSLGPGCWAFWAGAVHWLWARAQRWCAGELWPKLLTLPCWRSSSRCMDSRSHCFIWDVCASLLILYPAVSPGWHRRFMERSGLAGQRQCRPYFPVGCSRAGALPGSREWLCYAAQRFRSSGACTSRFHKISGARRAARPDRNQTGDAFLEQERVGRFFARRVSARAPRLHYPRDGATTTEYGC